MKTSSHLTINPECKQSQKCSHSPGGTHKSSSEKLADPCTLSKMQGYLNMGHISCTIVSLSTHSVSVFLNGKYSVMIRISTGNDWWGGIKKKS